MAEATDPIRISLLVDNIPEGESRNEFAMRLLEQCVDDDTSVYAPVPVGYRAFTNSLRRQSEYASHEAHMVRDPGNMPFTLSPDPDVRFLRLDREALIELIATRASTQRVFTRGGLSRSTQVQRGSEAGLQSTWFSCCCLRPIAGGAAVNNKVISVPSRGPRSGDDFYLGISIGDVHVEDRCAKTLALHAYTSRVVSWPLEGLERSFPGIYAMYQAAVALNQKKGLARDGLESWLRRSAPKGVFNAKRAETAAKFVQRELDRSQGRGHTTVKSYNLCKLTENEFGKTYKEPFISDGLGLVLYATDFWWDLVDNPSTTREMLRACLSSLGFYDGREVNDLAHIIAWGTPQGVAEPEKK